MKILRQILPIIVFLFVISCNKISVEKAPVDYVDLLLGTSSSRWMLYPGPSTPFSLVKLSPDNQRHCWKAGYEYTIENIAGFSHLHSWTMGGLLVMPTTGDLKTQPGTEGDPDAGYRSRFSHDREVAVPGYYAVTLEDYGIRAELASTCRAGWQRYTFPKAQQARILFDLLTPTEYNFEVLEAKITKVSDTEIEGYSKQRAGTWAKWNDYTVHFVARLNKPFRAMGGWTGDTIQRNVTEITGQALDFDLLDDGVKRATQVGQDSPAIWIAADLSQRGLFELNKACSYLVRFAPFCLHNDTYQNHYNLLS